MLILVHDHFYVQHILVRTLFKNDIRIAVLIISLFSGLAALSRGLAASVNITFSGRLIIMSMRGSTKFCQRGSNTDISFLLLFFYLTGWREDQNVIKKGPSLAPQRIAIEMAFCLRIVNGPIECWLGSFVILGDPDQYC